MGIVTINFLLEFFYSLIVGLFWKKVEVFTEKQILGT